jgi:hypothetical protein
MLTVYLTVLCVPLRAPLVCQALKVRQVEMVRWEFPVRLEHLDLTDTL